MTLLGRVGRHLARFVGSGFIQIVDGRATLVSSVALTIRHLWHGLYRVASHSVAVLGPPKDFPYGVVADHEGHLYGIQGFSDRRALHVWNFDKGTWETISPDQFPLEVSRRIWQTDGIELVGFEPVPLMGAQADVRMLKALSGAGIVYLSRVPTAGDDPPSGCEPCANSGFTYVARVLEFPTIATPGEPETGRHRIVYSSLGLYFEPEP
jgi:hypothetical protein